MRSFLFIAFIVITFLLSGCKNEQGIPYEEGFVVTPDSINLYYEKFGNGPEHIIIPGGMYLSPLFKQLASKNRTLIIYDQRARGQSSSINDSAQLGWKFEVSDMESIRQHFGFERVSIIGWSYTGAIAALYANEYAGNVNRVIQIGPLMPRKVPYFEEWIQVSNSRKDSAYYERIKLAETAFKESGDLETYIRDYYKIAHQPLLFNKNIKEVFRDDFYSSANEEPGTMWGFTFPSIIASFGNWDFRNQLPNVKMPVLIIHGDYDPIPLAASNEWNNILPDSRLWILKDAGHLPFTEQPEEVFHGIDVFLSGEWPDEAKNE